MKEALCRALLMALMALLRSPLVEFLKPTGTLRPLARLRWIWLSMVRAPMEAQLMTWSMYWGMIGSRTSQPTGRPR